MDAHLFLPFQLTSAFPSLDKQLLPSCKKKKKTNTKLNQTFNASLICKLLHKVSSVNKLLQFNCILRNYSVNIFKIHRNKVGLEENQHYKPKMSTMITKQYLTTEKKPKPLHV